MAKRKKGQKTSTREKRKQQYANMRESARANEAGANTDTGPKGRGRAYTGSTRYCKHARRAERRQEALTRRAEWSRLSPREQLRALTDRVGLDGAVRQRERIMDQIMGVTTL